MRGIFFENIVIEYLKRFFPVFVPPKAICDKYEQRHEHADEIDAFVCGKSIEIKSTKLKKWPKNGLFLCSGKAWRHKHTIDRWIIISQQTREMIFCTGEEANKYAYPEYMFDSRRGIEKYIVIRMPLQYFKPINQLTF